MLKRIRAFLSKTKNIQKSAYIWNSIDASLNAAESPVALMVIMRTNSTADAGVFSLAFAVGNLMIFLGQYGLRRYQSSDVGEKYSFGEYYGMRILSCIAMMIVSLGYCFYGSVFKGYDTQKFMIILMICGLKCVQAFSDVFHGRMQQMGRLDVATKGSTIRYIIEMVVLCVSLIITHDLMLSTLLFLISSTIVFCLTSLNAAVDYCDFKPSFKWAGIKGLLIDGAPLFLSLFLNMYLSNAPKFAIDTYLSDDIQALYNFIFMPAYVVQLAAHFIFNPILTGYAEVWVAKDITRFKKLIHKQMLFVAALAVLGLIVAATIGIPVLSVLFSADLSAYKKELCIVMIGGGALAYSIFFMTVITIIRLQNTLIAAYGAAAVAAFLFSGTFVKKYGMTGAATIYAIIMIVLAVLLGGIVAWRIRKEQQEIANGDDGDGADALASDVAEGE